MRAALIPPHNGMAKNGSPSVARVPTRRPWHATHPTTGGLGGAVFMLLVLYGALVSESNLLLLLVGMFVGLTLISALMSIGSVKRLEIVRRAPASVTRGTRFAIVYRIHNLHRWFSGRSVWIEERAGQAGGPTPSPAYIPRIPPGQTVELTLEATAGRRGRYRFERLAVRSSFPFGLIQTRISVSLPAEITVLPAPYPVREDVVGVRDARPGMSPRRARVRTGVDDFFGLREYRKGDNPRWIHWRRSVRVGQLLVREMLAFTGAQCTVVLDHRLADDTPKSAERREQAVSAAASLVCCALEGGVHVGLVGLGAPVVMVPPVGGREQRERLMRELALLSGRPDAALTQWIGQAQWSGSRAGRCLILTAAHDEEIDLLAQALRDLGIAPSVLEPGTPRFAQVFAPSAPASAGALFREQQEVAG
jgi:uncharacterized protein (DUF58 family)